MSLPSAIIKSYHQVFFNDARKLDFIKDESVELILTSPPYPMIEMWDDIFTKLNPSIGNALKDEDGLQAFELMHQELDRVWKECYRILKPGCIACINIGDAVRTIGGNFQMYSNHARILNAMRQIGFTPLPDILWRKQTNAPNKFMGSGMLPACAYVTYEHEYILIFRKGSKREFKNKAEKNNRRNSAFFWEERNIWFSDVWTDLKGTSQALGNQFVRNRSAAYPFELAYRLICMHSIYGDTILDPFLGTGTTTAVAIAASRNSLGIENDLSLQKVIFDTINSSLIAAGKRINERLSEHQKFIQSRIESGGKVKYVNHHYDLGTITSQETDILLYMPININPQPEGKFEVEYKMTIKS